MPDVPPPVTTHPRLLTRGPVRWWAIGAVLAVALVLLAAISARFLVTQARQAANRMPAPAWPLLRPLALAPSPPGMRARAVAVAGGRAVVLFTSDPPPCPAGARCPTPASAGQLDVLDGGSGRVLARQALPTTAVAPTARWLLADVAAQRVYAPAPDGVAVFSLDDAQLLAHWPLADGEVVGAALDRQGRLAIATTRALLRLDPASGQVAARQALPSGGDVTLAGPVYDAHADVLAVLASRAGSAPTLLRFRADALQSLGAVTLPAEMTLGPADPRGGVLLSGAGGRVWWLASSAESAPGAPPRLIERPALREARALGWDVARGRTLAVLPGGLVALATANGREEAAPVAGLPLAIAWPAEQPLAVDGARGRLYLPVGADGLLIAPTSPAPQAEPLDNLTASLLARAALARLLPPPSQQPPFFRASDLPILPGPRAWSFWVHAGDLGWLGPFAGTLRTSITPRAGQPGAYAITYEVAWEQLFRRTHTWRLAVAPDGAMRLIDERGDALP
ncbi:MAG TPA: hypothetical protein VFY89_02300 [Ktedonobacterales bacterium]